MKGKQDSVDFPSPRKFYVKRKQMREESSKDASSIFTTANSQTLLNFTTIDDTKKYQTVTTAIDNTLTLHSNAEEPFDEQQSQTVNRSDFLPKLKLGINSKLSTSQNQTKLSQIKQKAISCHVSDPHYLRLEKTLLKRVAHKFGNYRQGWSDQIQRRKEKSVLERSLERAALSIQYINLDARNRKNTTDLSEMLRNNIAEKTFVFPSKIRPDIDGLKGKGGKVVPIFSEVYLIQQVYKYSKGVQEISK